MRFFSLLGVTTALLIKQCHSEAVFAHYMVGTVTEAHAHQDIDNAKAMGFDGFALNIGDPTQPFVDTTLHDLFGYAEYIGGFSLYISMDVYASGAACYSGSTGSCNGPFDYKDILTWTLGSSAYYKGTPNGFPLISTFSSGGFENTEWTSWKSTLANQMYFVPDFDETSGYYGGQSSYSGWYYYWGPVVDGLFSWESAWPERGNPNPGTLGGAYPGDIGPDLTVQTGAIQNGKGYMMGLSTLQYKDAYGTNIYRGGGSNLPQRMANILGMSTKPGWIVVQTWNDGPESHYVGNIWPEQNSDAAPALYMGPSWPHTGWLPLIQSFITAYKNGGSTSSMVPGSGQPYITGAIWYRTILVSSQCPNDDGGSSGTQYEKPDGFDSAHDEITFAVLLPQGATGYKLNIYSNWNVVEWNYGLNQGLNFATVSVLYAGDQWADVVDGNGNVVYRATGGMAVSGDCPDGIYNMNYQVVPFAQL